MRFTLKINFDVMKQLITVLALILTCLADDFYNDTNGCSEERETCPSNNPIYSKWRTPFTDRIHPVFQSIYQVAEKSHQESVRVPRFIRLFPAGSQLFHKFWVIVPIKNITMYIHAYNFDMYAVTNYPAFLKSLFARKKRSVRSPPNEEEKRNLLRLKREEKRSVFSKIEEGFETFGLPARACLLRTVCEIGEEPYLEGLFGELLNSILRATLSPDIPMEDKIHSESDDYRDFIKAEMQGKRRGHCDVAYSKCPYSVIEKLHSFLNEL